MPMRSQASLHKELQATEESLDWERWSSPEKSWEWVAMGIRVQGKRRGMEWVEVTVLRDLWHKHQVCSGALENQPRWEKEKGDVKRNPRQWQRLLHRAKREARRG